MEYKIGHKGQINEKHWTLSEQISGQCRNVLIRKSCKWQVQVEATLSSDKSTVRSNIVEIEVRFPNISEIKSDSVVVAAMLATWEHTKASASTAGRQEFGFWIYFDSRDGRGSYFCGAQTPGDKIANCKDTNGSLKPGRIDNLVFSTSPLEGERRVVAIFHTHTPLTYCTEKETMYRIPVGPSPSDDTWASSEKIPGLVYDYKGSYFENGLGIKSGHKINGNAQVYDFGPDRAETPKF
jgi:hypothetical protein